MRRISLLLALAFAVLPLSADTIRFDPPAPTTETFVSMRYEGAWAIGCSPADPEVSRAGSVVTVKLTVKGHCAPELPAIGYYQAEAPLGVLAAGENTIVVEAWENSKRYELARETLVVRGAMPVIGGSRIEVAPQVVFPGQMPIVIRAEDIGTCPDLVNPCNPPTVTFNGVEGDVIRHRSDEITVRPPHLGAASSVDVEILEGDVVIVRLENAIRVATPEFDPSLFERILIPVIYNGPGAQGSQWRTDVVMHNHSNAFIPRLFTQEQLIGCAPGYCDVPLEPGETRVLGIDDAPGGYLMHIARGQQDDLAINILFRDMTRQATALGAEMPVIRESEFLTGRSAILNVPTDQKYRIALRGYASYRGTIHFKVYRMDGTLLLDHGLLTLDRGDDVTPYHDVIGDLMDRYPELGGMGPFRIVFEGLDSIGDDRYWVFASITNNETQHVTLITPQ